ncbi:MAG: efflux RND transporter periplasmic adaptor subunit [Candidatus Sericytochromatia bacterium]|nr:efflux RND transporter periplasmic adaptor subunit [Candidatus Sericytochromatia bacterium]
MPVHPHRLLALTALALALVACRGEAPPAEPSEAPQDSAGGTLQLSEAVRQHLALQLTPVSRRDFSLEVNALGDVVTRPESEAVVHAPLTGQLAEVRVGVGDAVTQGQTLAIIRSAELGRAQASYLKALGEARLARREWERQQRLFADTLASRRELETAVQERDASQIALSQAAEELRLLGFDQAQMDGLARRGHVDPLHRLRAPVSGLITQRHATRGDRVAPEDAEPLFALADMRTVRVETDIPERNWRLVRAGQAARIAVDALGGSEIAARVVRVAPLLDVNSHTGKALIDVPNREGLLRPGMSARVRIDTGRVRSLAVSTMALLQEGERSFVFVAEGEDRFREVTVTPGARNGQWVGITTGLTLGQRVVSQGAFDLQSEARKASFGGE